MKIIQIEHSGSTQTSYYPTPVQPDTTLAILATEGKIIERADLVECVALTNVDRVVQVKSGGAYAGTTGRFFAVLGGSKKLNARFDSSRNRADDRGDGRLTYNEWQKVDGKH